MRVQLVPKLRSPIPSFEEPAPKRFRTKVWRPLSTRQMIEMAVRRGKGYWGILDRMLKKLTHDDN